MIDSIRQTVLAVLNKNNFGYVSPSDFNQFAKQAQLEIFDEYFDDFNKAVFSENARKAGSGFGDRSKAIAEAISIFVRGNDVLGHVSDNIYLLPSVATTGFDYYLLNNIYVLSAPAGAIIGESEAVQPHLIHKLTLSPLTYPTEKYSSHVINGDRLEIYPSTINVAGRVVASYVRYPKPPKWTYLTVSGNPVFNPSASDYQDIELPLEDEYRMVVKILQYMGIAIREQDVYTFAKRDELENKGVQ
jgi:hypothetical protein